MADFLNQPPFPPFSPNSSIPHTSPLPFPPIPTFPPPLLRMMKKSAGQKSSQKSNQQKKNSKPVQTSAKRSLKTNKAKALKGLAPTPVVTTQKAKNATAAKKPNVFFKIARGGKELGVVEFELYDDIVPRTTENFRQLCLGSKKVGNTPLHYKGSSFHRVIKQFMIQGGDFTNHNGTGGISIYGSRFPDEPNGLRLRHNRPGLLSMANAGPNTNGSQFFVTTVATPWLDGKHVVFGGVVSGFDVVKQIEMSPANSSDKPLQPIVIVDCGEVV